MARDLLEDVRDFYAAVASGDFSRAEAKLSLERIVIFEAESLPYGGSYRGVDGYRELARRLGASWKRVRFDDLKLAQGENRVVAHFVMTATGRATGIEIAFPVVEILDFEDDRIVSIRPFLWDTHALRKALGID